MFFKGSRYENTPEGMIKDSRGRKIRYKRLRLIPDTPYVREHVVGQAERLDLLAHDYFQNPELFWRICDANCAMLPGDLLEEIGGRILIPPALR